MSAAEERGYRKGTDIQTGRLTAGAEFGKLKFEGVGPPPTKKNRQYVYQLMVQRTRSARPPFSSTVRAFPAVAMGPAAEEHAAA